MTQTDFSTILPVTILAAWASLLLLADLFLPHERKGWTALLARSEEHTSELQSPSFGDVISDAVVFV